MDAIKYKEILEEDFLPVAAEIMDDSFILQHDGASSHTAGDVTKLLDSMEIEYFDWPPRSPDLNPIENIWSVLKYRVYKRGPQTVEDLENFIFEEWDLLDDDMVGNVARSFSSRLEQIIEVNGDVLNY